MIGLVVLGTSCVVRSSWQLEMKDEASPATEEGVPVA